MEENVKKWYVLRAIGGKEKKVKELVENEIKRLKLDDFISRFLFLLRKFTRLKWQKISKERIYYPGYVLIEAALVGEIPHILRNIPMSLVFR